MWAQSEWELGEPEVVSLLLHLFQSTVQSDRHWLLTDKEPNFHLYKPTLRSLLADVRRLKDVLAKMPCLGQLYSKMWRDHLERADAEAYTLLRWIVAGSSTELRFVKNSNTKPPGLGGKGPLDFLPVSAQLFRIRNKTWEEQFERAKKGAGGTSVFAFHGSPPQHWISILRKGLFVASGTPYQVNGTAKGRGIYLSRSSADPVSYSLRNRSTLAMVDLSSALNCLAHHDHDCSLNGRFPLQSAFLACFAICEVVVSETLHTHEKGWVVSTKEEEVLLRFLVVFDARQADAYRNLLIDCHIDSCLTSALDSS